MLESHVDQYCQDAWELYEQMQDSPDCEVSVEVLNSLLYLNTVAIRPLEIESKILPLYQQHKLKYDENTYAHLAKLYLDKRELDKVVELFDRS